MESARLFLQEHNWEAFQDPHDGFCNSDLRVKRVAGYAQRFGPEYAEQAARFVEAPRAHFTSWADGRRLKRVVAEAVGRERHVLEHCPSRARQLTLPAARHHHKHLDHEEARERHRGARTARHREEEELYFKRNRAPALRPPTRTDAPAAVAVVEAQGTFMQTRAAVQAGMISEDEQQRRLAVARADAIV
eukprot:g4563.t1